MGRKPHKPTEGMREQVSIWSAAGLTQMSIAAMIGINVDTFRKYYVQDYDGGVDAMVAKLFNIEYDVAVDKERPESQKARHFLLKTRGKYSEKQEIELSAEISIDGLTDDELIAIATSSSGNTSKA